MSDADDQMGGQDPETGDERAEQSDRAPEDVSGDSAQGEPSRSGPLGSPDDERSGPTVDDSIGKAEGTDDRTDQVR